MIARMMAALCLLALSVIAPEAMAQGDSFVLRAGWVYPASEDDSGPIVGGVVIVREGRIEAVGPAAMSLPVDLPIIDLPDATVIPGLVLASSSLAGPHPGEESISAAYRAVEEFDRFADYRRILAGGVTTVHLSPGEHRLMSGQGAVVRLGGNAWSRVLEARADLSITLGEGAANPPRIVDLLVPPSPDRAITPARPQRPASRLGQFIALKDAIEAARRGEGDFDIHLSSLAEAWKRGSPLRIHAHRAADLEGALEYLRSTDRKGYIVGGWEAARVARTLAAANVPLVYTIETSLRDPGPNRGGDPDALLPELGALAQLSDLRLALALTRGMNTEDLRLAASLALRAGLDEARVLAAITRIPAEVLGVSDRVGSIEAGKDADLVILTGPPLATSSHVTRVFVRGRTAYQRPASNATVVRGGTLWLGPNDSVRDGSILIEDGRITAVGPRVPHPPGARLIDAGPSAFITPGFIDALGHLGLEGDRTQLTPEFSLAGAVGPAGRVERRVARSGVTTVMTAPYTIAANGSQIAAVKTAGATRDQRVVAPTAGVLFDLSGVDHAGIEGRLRPRLEAGKRYADSWAKYHKDLEDWEKKRAAGEAPTPPPAPREETREERAAADPITGTWKGTVSGGPMPNPQEGKVVLQLTGSTFEGRVVEPDVPVGHRIVATLTDKSFSGRIEIDDTNFPSPVVRGTLPEDDRMTGTISVMGFAADFEAWRIDKGAVEFRPVVRRTVAPKDGRPTPPKVDEGLEPLRAMLEGRVPAIMDVRTPAQVKAVLDFAEQWKFRVVLLNAPGAEVHADRLAQKGVGVIAPTSVLRETRSGLVHQGDALSRRGVPMAFQSDGEDAAAALPAVALFAVHEGMSADAALAALTIEPAKMYHINDRIGAIAPGRDGDLLIFSGHPMDAGSALLRVLVSGQEVHP